MEHHFNIEIAQKYGVNEAIFLNNLGYWLMINKANNKNFHENKFWSYNSIESFLAIFPYFSIKNIRTTIKSCIDKNLVITGNFNKRKSDRTLWYSLTELGLSLVPSINNMQVLPKGTIKEDTHLSETANETGRGLQGDRCPQTRVVEHLPETANPFAENGKALPYIKPDIKLKDNIYCPSDKKNTVSKKTKKEKKSFRTLPEDFMYNEKHKELAKSLNIDIDNIFTNFKEKSIMKGYEYICWDTAFMNWIRNSPKYSQPVLSIVPKIKEKSNFSNVDSQSNSFNNITLAKTSSQPSRLLVEYQKNHGKL